MACIDLTACCQGEKSYFTLPALTLALAASELALLPELAEATSLCPRRTETGSKRTP